MKTKVSKLVKISYIDEKLFMVSVKLTVNSEKLFVDEVEAKLYSDS